jgi:hypothetical protein
MENRFIPAFSFNHVEALYRSTIHSAMHSIRRWALREKTFLWVSTHERGFFTLKGPSIQNWPIQQQGIPSTRLPSFNRANVTVLTLAACPALQRPIPVRRRYNEAGLPI